MWIIYYHKSVHSSLAAAKKKWRYLWLYKSIRLADDTGLFTYHVFLYVRADASRIFYSHFANTFQQPMNAFARPKMPLCILNSWICFSFGAQSMRCATLTTITGNMFSFRVFKTQTAVVLVAEVEWQRSQIERDRTMSTTMLLLFRFMRSVSRKEYK